MGNRIKCADCVFTHEDKNASEKGWTAYECGNPSSEFHKALLNVTISGNKLTNISWSGCALGRAAGRTVAR